jgi:hypothetical protein
VFLISSFVVLCFGTLGHYGVTADLGVSNAFFGTNSLHSYINNFNSVLTEGNALAITISIFAYLVLILGYLNFIVDCIELNTKTKKWERKTAIVRYAAFLLMLIVFAILAYVQTPNFGQFGILFYIVLALAVIHLLVAILRLILVRKQYVKSEAAQEGEDIKQAATMLANEHEVPEQHTVVTIYPTVDTTQNAQPAQPNTVYVPPVYSDENEQLMIEALDPYADTLPEQTKSPYAEAQEGTSPYATPEAQPAPANTEAAATETAPEAEPAKAYQEAPAPVYTYPAQSAPVYTEPYAAPEAQPVYNQPVYEEPVAKPRKVYPTDKFISTLTDTEKAEFSRLFLEDLAYDNIPQYVVNGDNERFFSCIFLYLGRFRSVLSDGLLNKIYLQLNLLH